MAPELIDPLGNKLYEALKACRTLAPLTDRHPNIKVDDAYAIPQRMLKRRLAAAERVLARSDIVDSRIQERKIKIHHSVADNASCGVFVGGDRMVESCNPAGPWRACARGQTSQGV